MGTKRVEPNWHYQGTVCHTSLGPLLVLYLLKRMNERGVSRRLWLVLVFGFLGQSFCPQPRTCLYHKGFSFCNDVNDISCCAIAYIYSVAFMSCVYVKRIYVIVFRKVLGTISMVG